MSKRIFEAGEMYLEALYILKQEQEDVRSVDIVNYTGKAKSSVSQALNTLKDDGFITIDDNGFLNFTPKREKHAFKIYDRHLTLTKFFISLGVSEEQAEIDACKFEHDISEETFKAIKKHLEKHKN
jgi:DtxR family Mn-dependent transcriptional regulator